MKKILIIVLLLIGCNAVRAQEGIDSIPIYKRFPTVPPFSIMRVPDSIKITKDDLRKKRALVIVIFSPDCDHCKHFTKELLLKYDLIKNATVLMTSSLNYEHIQQFYDANGLAAYPNITAGRDGSGFLTTFFHVKSFPTVIIYNRKGKFVTRFDEALTIEKIAAEL